MSLAHLLPTIRRLDQLPALAAALGHEPCWEELDLPGAGPAVIVGRRGSFLALGLRAAPAESAARRMARALAARGVAALVLALDESRALVALAACLADAPVLAVALDRPRAIDLDRLARGRAAASGESAAGLVAHWAEALGGVELGGRFFREFRRQLRRFVHAMPRAMPPADRHARGLLGLTRVLFLYFVQDKGWLDGRPRFLREELDRCLAAGRPVERGLLAPLCFGTLNVPPARRAAGARRFGAVPFLNGGLFEPQAVDRRWAWVVPDEVWRDAFDELFERYHFATARGPASIGPDMLGRVFEGVMDPGDRRAEGTFFTPAALVDELVDAALAHWLAARLRVGADSGRALLDRPDAAAVRAVREVTVLDPAVGSGAFLLGALRRLVGIRVAGGEARRDATRAVLQRNLFGVDRNPSAVRLAELRLWLEVIAAEPPGRPGEVEPLPNLDGVVRQGDSLAEPVSLPPGEDGGARRRLAALRARLVAATGAAKRRDLRALRRAELALCRAGLERAIAVLERRIADAAGAARAPDLFAGSRPTPRALARAIGEARLERRRLRQLRRRLDQAGELPWFQYEAQFGDVMAAGGFDLVLGNPPWVRAESLPAADRRTLGRRFAWFRSAGGAGFAHLPDLSIAFLERGFGLLRPGGVTGVLLPAKLLTAGYAATAREELARRATVLALADLTDRARSAFDATVYPLALVVARGPAPPGHEIELGLDGRGGRLPQAALGRCGWPAGAAADRLATESGWPTPTVAERFRIRLGAKTGLDCAFLDPPDAVERSLVRAALRGRDVRPFRVRPRRRLLWPHDAAGHAVPRLPPGAARHLAPFVGDLRRRADYRTGPWWTLFRTAGAASGHRVVWRDLARRLECAVVSSPRVVPLNTTYYVRVTDRDTALRLAGWLNADCVRRLASARATVAASGHRRFNAAVVGALPLPGAVLRDEPLLRIASAAQSGEPVDQAALDARAAELLSHAAGEDHATALA